ncbi:DUF5071 domain-containing protein [Denitrobaculum tricleocarpae]|uniref:DUF5071 domain-containing protein n=1 Tax=Denitrobaculum tricleocarpae TaxID=2591009 RepID=A0A545TYG4_9PROT|nr:DUF5071 domain-containing protein [Denitrobaculum tricleocarpae]TQV82213.1 DUF5071 domain-containing protein [Denitrobaculum tricleocarpae]
MQLELCIPKDKYDVAAVRRASSVGFPALNPVVPELLEWLQDYNWPVARHVSSLLAAAGPEVAPHIDDALNSDDAIWKFWIIENLAGKLRPTLWQKLYPTIQRIAEHPTAAEIEEEVHLAAKAALESRHKG